MYIHRKHVRIALGLTLALILLPLLAFMLPALALASPVSAEAPLTRYAPVAIPRNAKKYRLDLIRNARHVWGLHAPIAVMAAQIHQESHWNKNVASKYASGLAQFTPDTADWISGAYPKSLGAHDPLSPNWAMRAMATYDKLLYDNTEAATQCDRMWKALWKYNGGAGWVARDEALAARHGANILSAKEVEPFNAGRAPAMFKENREYPRAILLKWQPVYALWGGEITCS